MADDKKEKIAYSDFKILLEMQRGQLDQSIKIRKLAEFDQKSQIIQGIEAVKSENDLKDELKYDKEINENIKELVKLTKDSVKNVAKIIVDKTPEKAEGKFSSLRNTLDTMGIVKKGTGGMFDRALHQREEDKKFVKGDMKLNGTTQQEARNKLFNIKEHEKKIYHNEKEINNFTKLGISEEQLAKTSHGKRLLSNRKEGVQALAAIDYRVEGNVDKEETKTKKKAPIGNTPISVARTANPAIKSDELEQEAISREEGQTELLKRIAENTGGKEKFKAPAPAAEEGGGLGALGLIVGGIIGGVIGFVRAWAKSIKLFFDVLVPESFKTSLGNIFKNIMTFFEDVGSNIKKLFTFGEESVIGKVLLSFKEGIATLSKPFVAAYDTIKGLIAGSEAIGGIFSSIAEYIGKFGKYIGKVAVIAEKIFLPLTIILTLWDTVKGAFKGWEEGGLVGAIGGAIKGFFNSLVFGFVDLIKDGISWILGAIGFKSIEKMLDSFSFSDLFSSFVDAVLFIPQTIQNLIMHPIDSLKKLANIVTDAFSAIGDLFKPITDFFSNIGKSIIGMLEGIGIPEMGFTIPIIGKKVSIGPFYPFKKTSEKPIEGGGDKEVPDAPAADSGSKRGDSGWNSGKANTNPDGSPMTLDQINAAKDALRAGNVSDPGRTDASSSPASQPAGRTTSTETYTKIAGERVVPGQPLSGKQMAIIGMSTSMGNKYPPEIMEQYNKQLNGDSKANALAPESSTGNIVAGKSNEVADARDNMNAGSGKGNAIVSAPTTINNQTTNTSTLRSPFRNEDATLNKYIGSRYAAF